MSESKVRISAASVGINGLAMNAEQTSNYIETEDASHVEVRFKTNTRSAFTAIHFEADWYSSQRDTDNSPVAHGTLGESDAISGGYYVHSLYPEKWTYTTSATVTGKSFVIPVKDRGLKLRVSSTGGAESESIYVEVVLIRP